MRAALSRLRKAESELEFQQWILFSRTVEAFSAEQLLAYAERGELPDPIPPSLNAGKSTYDGLSKKALLQLWSKEEQSYARTLIEEKTFIEVLFYLKNGRFPDEAGTRQQEQELMESLRIEPEVKP